mmetsp:Transcript_22786/g.46550  ORF Transcript_22786/g.46550 Transcript_22786/m.46550 type:complete len:136 (-) Transcript_22786:148-555(-)
MPLRHEQSPPPFDSPFSRLALLHHESVIDPHFLPMSHQAKDAQSHDTQEGSSVKGIETSGTVDGHDAAGGQGDGSSRSAVMGVEDANEFGYEEGEWYEFEEELYGAEIAYGGGEVGFVGADEGVVFIRADEDFEE